MRTCEFLEHAVHVALWTAPAKLLR